MKTPEKQFEDELEIFGHEVEICLQCLYAYDTIQTMAARDKDILEVINYTPLFWITIEYALLSSYFITLHRIFDKKAKHVKNILQVAQDNISIFSKKSLAARKKRLSANDDKWLDAYMENVYEPCVNDFKTLNAYVEKYLKKYENGYEAIRHRIFAHKGVSDKSESNKLFQKTNISEMQKLSMFLSRLNNALWQLFYNGSKPVHRMRPFSTKKIIGIGEKKQMSNSIQDVVVADTKKLMSILKTIKGNPVI